MKIREIIGGSLAMLAFLWILGTAGALEHDNITMLQAILQGLGGFAVGWIGIKITGAEFK